MAKIWYSVMKTEHKLAQGGDTLMAGVVFRVAKFSDLLVQCTQVFGAKKTYYFTPEQCRMLMTKPAVDFDSVMEESFMQSEANYC